MKFKKNLRAIEEHNDRDDVGFKMGVNAFSDMTFDEFHDSYGMKEEYHKLLQQS